MSLDQILMIPGIGGGSVPSPPAEYPEAAYLPTVSSSPYMGYALRQLDATYTGDAIRVRRSSDNAESDIGFVNGALDTATLETFCSGTDGFVTTWYEQTGNGVDLTQSTAGNQPQIVASGSVITDVLGRPKIKVLSTSELTATHGSTLSSDNMTVLQEIQRGDVDSYNAAVYFGFNLGSLGSEFTLRYENGYTGRFFTNSSNLSLIENTGARTHYSFWPSISCFRSDASTATVWRNHGKTLEVTASGSASTSTSFKVGHISSSSENILVGDVVVYPYLDDADRLSVYQSMNAYYEHGPNTVASTAIIDQSETWHVTLYIWLNSLVESDFDISRSTLSWDGTYADVDELSNLWLFVDEATGVFGLSDAFKSQSSWYVLDDGIEGGIEGSGVLRHFYTGSQNGSQAGNIAAWYATSFPKSGGTEGNPYYQQQAVGYRALVMAAVNLIGSDALGYDHDQRDGGSVEGGGWLENVQPSFLGGQMLGSVEAYIKCKSLLSTSVQEAFIDGFKWCIAKLLSRGAAGVNSNMDCKAIAAICLIYSELDETYKSLAVKAVKRILFGGTAETPNETMAASNWYDAVGNPSGIASPYGIVEGRSPETNYNGQSIRYLSIALSAVRWLVEFSFLDDVLESLGDWYTYQTFPDGSGTEGPSGYAGRTGGSIWNSDQGASYIGRDVTLADQHGEFLPLVYRKSGLVDAATMSSAITSKVSNINSAGFDSTLDVTGSSAAHTGGSPSYVVTLTNTPDLSGVNIGTGASRRWYIKLELGSGSRWYQLSAVDDGADTITIDSDAFTVVGDTFTATSHRLAQNQDIYFTSTGTLPTGISADTAYYVRDLTDNTFKVAATPGGSAITVSGGSGTHSYSEWGRVNIDSGSPVNYTITTGAREYHTDGSNWPDYHPWYPSSGWHTTLKALVDGAGDSVLLPWERSDSFSTSVNDEVWFHKGNDGTLDFGWMVTAFEKPGGYKGWYGGNLECFWVEGYGCCILCKHDKSGSDTPDENTRVWAEIDTWAVTHVWGVTDGGLNFSSAATDNNELLTRSTTVDLVSSPKTLTYSVTQGVSEHTAGDTADAAFKGMEYSTELTATAHTGGVASRTFNISGSPDLSGIDTTNRRYVLDLNDGVYRVVASVDDVADTITIAASESTETIDSGSPVTCTLYQVPLAGYMTTTTVFKENTAGDGINVTTTVTSDNADKVDTLWGTIPILLQRNNEAGSDATLSYWDGGTWLPLPSTPTSVDWIRCRRNHGAGDKDVFIHFTSTQSIRKSTTVYVQDYQEDTRIQPVRVDLHPSTGTTSSMPASVSFSYDVQTTDPGLTPTNPVASITYPTSSDNLPVGRRWAVYAGVTWYGTASFQVDLEYSTDNQSSWNTVGTMTLVSGTEGTTACEYRYFGGTIPTGVTNIRINASDNIGTTNAGTEVTIASTTYTQVLLDPFTGTNGTTIGSSYSGWTTNTTGNSYVDISPPEIQSNAASCSADSPSLAQGAAIKVLANGENNDMIVEADVVSNNASNDTYNKSVGIGCRNRTSNATTLGTTGLHFVLDCAGGGGSAAQLRESGTAMDTISISGFANGTVYRMSLDVRSNIVVYQVRNSSSDAVISEGVVFNASYRLTEDDGKNAAVFVYKASGGSSDTADDFKVWIP